MSMTTYHPGGFQPTAPAQNRAERLDVTGYTRWNAAGGQVEQRALTPAETAMLATQDALALAGSNEKSLRDKASTALTANATFIAATKPGTAAAQASAAYDQSVKLTRQTNALIRLVIGQLDDTTGT